ncbi:MAG: hypothetical protein LBC07_05305, partial [Elusimicrobiota bacterium]|nr:hypothetical protein [Elusimicrobiota bacterium]
ESLHGAAIFAELSKIDFTNADVLFSGNILSAETNIESLTYFLTSSVTFSKSNAAFINNDLGYYGAFNLNDSSAYFLDSKINFENNIALEGASLYADESRIYFENSSAVFSANTAQNSGAAAVAKNNAHIYFLNSTVAFINNLGKTGALDINYSTITFANSNVIFANNSVYGDPDILLDAHLNNGFIVFEGENVLPNGIRIDEESSQAGRGAVVKTGEETLTFEGGGSLIGSAFNILEGRVKFNSAISTAAVLNVNAGAAFSLANNNQYDEFYIFGNFNLKGILELDINLFEGLGDWIFVGGKFSVDNATLSLNSIVTDGKENVKILTARQEFTYADLDNLYIEQDGFAFTIDRTSLGWDLIIGRDGLWNEFALAYQKAPYEYVLELPQTISALLENKPRVFGLNAATIMTFDGKGYGLNAGGEYKNLGFILENSSFTFINISFTNFTNENSSGAVISVNNSTLQFLSTVNFDKNISQGENAIGGGVVSAQNSWIDFNRVNSNFRNNISSNVGGAFAAYNSKITFTNSNLTFADNLAKSSGAAFYLQSSTIIWKNSNINFRNNFANNLANDIYFADAQSAIIFEGQNVLAGGIKISGDPNATVIKTGKGNLQFEGDKTIIESSLEVFEGGVLFNSVISSVSFIDMHEGTLLSLQDGNDNTKLFSENLILSGDLALDINFKTGQSDTIIVSSITILSGRKLIIKDPNPYDLTVREIPIIKTSTDSFFVTYSARNFTRVEDIFIYDQNLYKLRFDKNTGVLLIEDIKPFDLDVALTDNEKIIQEIVNENGFLKMPMTRLDIIKQRHALDSLSGVFYANIFMNSLLMDVQSFFSQMHQAPLFKVLVTGNISKSEVLKHQQTLGKFEAESFGALMATDLFANRVIRVGILLASNYKTFNQENNTANLIEAIGGMYWDLRYRGFSGRALVNGKYAQGTVSREIELDKIYKPTSNISLTGAGAALNLEYMFLLNRKPNLQQIIGPFIIYELSQINIGETDEMGGEITNLHFPNQIKNSQIIKSGLEFRQRNTKTEFFINVFAGQNINEAQEFEAEFIDSEQKFKIESDTEDLLFYGGQIGLNLSLTKTIMIGAQFNMHANDNLMNYNASLNMQYKLPNKSIVPRPKLPKLTFVENSSTLTRESAVELANFAKQFVKAKVKYKRLVIFVRVNKSKDAGSVSTNKLILERANNVAKILNKNKIPKRKISFGTKQVTTKEKIGVRVER